MSIEVLPEANRRISDDGGLVPRSVTGIPVFDEPGPPTACACHGKDRPDWHEPTRIVATQLATFSLQYVPDRGAVMFHCLVIRLIVTEVAGGDDQHLWKIQCQELLSQARRVHLSQHQWNDTEVFEGYLQEWQLYLDGVLHCVGLAGRENRGAPHQELHCIRPVAISHWRSEYVCVRKRRTLEPHVVTRGK